MTRGLEQRVKKLEDVEFGGGDGTTSLAIIFSDYRNREPRSILWLAYDATDDKRAARVKELQREQCAQGHPFDAVARQERVIAIPASETVPVTYVVADIYELARPTARSAAGTDLISNWYELARVDPLEYRAQVLTMLRKKPKYQKPPAWVAARKIAEPHKGVKNHA